MPPLIFPETADFINKSRKSKKVSFTYLLAVIYIYGGVSVFLWIVSKTILHPLFEQLTYDRRVYHNKAIDLVRDFNVKLATIVSYIPAIRASRAGEKYSDAQTQTDASAEGPASASTSSAEPNTYVHASVSTSSPASSGAAAEKSVSFETDLTPSEAASARTQKLCDKLSSLAQNLKTLGDETKVDNADPLRYSADRLKSLSDTLYSGLELERTAGTKPRTEMVAELKKEIRSFKGSFLSARSFPSVYR